MNRVRLSALLAASVAVTAIGCSGGGGGSGDDSATVVTPPPAASKTRIVTGPISGFGSVIVNGVRYETSSAEVRVEDRAGTLAELAVGQVVRIEADVDDRGGARARRIDRHHLVQGAVEALDLAAGTVTIAGQVIHVDDDTSFDDSISAGSLEGISVGDRIEVHGLAGTAGHALATRVERAGAGETEVEVTGTVTGLDPVARRFRVGSLAVDYSSAVLEDFGAGGLREGDLVEVKGREFLADGALRAQVVDREDDSHGVAGTEVEVEGLITRFVSTTEFDVAGREVRTTPATIFVAGTPTDLALDARVEAEGALDATGVLVAAKIAFKRRGALLLSAPVEAVDAAAGTLRALGLTIVVDAATRTEDKESDDQFFALDDLRVGDWIEVRGYQDPAGTGRIVATRLERDEAEDEVELRGPASDLQSPRFRILGVAVETVPATEFEDAESRIDAATFFARANGLPVEVEGAWNGSTLTARKAEIEREHAGAGMPPPTTPPPGTGNRAPVANAGTPVSVSAGTVVTLDAGASSDPDGDALIYSWTLTRPAGSTAVLASPDAVSATFTADVAGSFMATVSVSDGQLSSAASVTVTVQAPGSGLDGAALYAANCSGCHGAITAIRSMPVASRNLADIRRAIGANRGGMGFLSGLTDAQLLAIVDAMRTANP